MAASMAAHVIDQRQSSLVTLVVALSMVSTPLLLLVHRRLTRSFASREVG
jgi:Kef-type K+ transport system membrane component KefB